MCVTTKEMLGGRFCCRISSDCFYFCHIRHIIKLPPELLEMTTDELAIGNLARFATTCKLLKQRLLPHAYYRDAKAA